MPANSSETIQRNQMIKDQRRGRGVLSRVYVLYRLYGAADTKAKEQEQVKKTTVLLWWKEKETHRKEPILSEPKGSDNLQDKT